MGFDKAEVMLGNRNDEIRDAYRQILEGVQLLSLTFRPGPSHLT